jgi:CheY-like chemotaxis protein
MNMILVVEDNPNQQFLIEEELHEVGYRVMCASSGHKAVQMVRDECPDCVVLDINMPDMDGLEIFNEILQIDPQVPVIVNTAYAAYPSNFLGWAADAYVVKSGDLAELKERITEVLARGKTSG